MGLRSAGISLKTQELYALVFICRYLDLFTRYVSLCAPHAAVYAPSVVKTMPEGSLHEPQSLPSSLARYTPPRASVARSLLCRTRLPPPAALLCTAAQPTSPLRV